MTLRKSNIDCVLFITIFCSETGLNTIQVSTFGPLLHGEN